MAHKSAKVGCRLRALEAESIAVLLHKALGEILGSIDQILDCRGESEIPPDTSIHLERKIVKKMLSKKLSIFLPLPVGVAKTWKFL